MPVYFYTDFQGNICRLALPLEPSVKDIIFERLADPTMRQESSWNSLRENTSWMAKLSKLP
jgi:hypothetical protein